MLEHDETGVSRENIKVIYRVSKKHLNVKLNHQL